MFTSIAADVVVLIHLAFILFVAVGGLLVIRQPRVAWLHVPAVLWGAVVELAGWICPLTPLENRLRAAAGDAAYTGGFIERYLVPVVYPVNLTRPLQIAIGCAVIGINLVVYGAMIARELRRGRSDV